MYHNSTDRITDIFNNLIKITEQDNCGELLEALRMFKTYEGYELAFTIRNEYRNGDIMFEAILQTTDKLLEWFDVTEISNFNILVHINDYTQKYIKMNYFELFERMLKRGSGYDPHTFRMRGDYAIIHPRYERFMRWAGERKRREEFEKEKCKIEQERIKRMLDGGISLFHQSDLVLPVSEPKKKSWVRKIKEKILSL
jgi:hypothetical protein